MQLPKNIIFIRIPKTASTSIIQAFRISNEYGKYFYEYWHRRPCDIIRITGLESWNNSFIFTVIRNTFDRFYSWYNHLVNMNINEVLSERDEKDKGWDNGIIKTQQFIKEYNNVHEFLLLAPKGNIRYYFPPQKHYITIPPNAKLIDKIINFKTVNKDIDNIFGIKLLVLNEYKHKPWNEVLTLEDINRIKEIYPEDKEFYDI
jgi:hypothetical protein